MRFWKLCFFLPPRLSVLVYTSYNWQSTLRIYFWVQTLFVNIQYDGFIIKTNVAMKNRFCLNKATNVLWVFTWVKTWKEKVFPTMRSYHVAQKYIKFQIIEFNIWFTIIWVVKYYYIFPHSQHSSCLTTHVTILGLVLHLFDRKKCSINGETFDIWSIYHLKLLFCQ